MAGGAALLIYLEVKRDKKRFVVKKGEPTKTKEPVLPEDPFTEADDWKAYIKTARVEKKE